MGGARKGLLHHFVFAFLVTSSVAPLASKATGFFVIGHIIPLTFLKELKKSKYQLQRRILDQEKRRKGNQEALQIVKL